MSGGDSPATLPTPSSPGYGFVAKISPTNASLALAIPNAVNFSQQLQYCYIGVTFKPSTATGF
jgi:hypothetical protein